MNPEQIALIQASFGQLRPIAEQAAALFYQRLFALDADLRLLFRGDMAEQGRKLMTMLAVVVRGLEQPDTLMPLVVALGRRHHDYGVTAAHYATVGAALLWTLEQGLGPLFTPAVAQAWASAYTLLATEMKQAASKAAAHALSATL